MKSNYSFLTPLSVGVAALVATPVVFAIASAVNVDPGLWVKLYHTRFNVLFSNTVKLMLAVGTLCLIIGVTSAWVVTRYNFCGRGIWQWALILPLAIPGYVMAYAYATIMAPGGVVETAWRLLFGQLSTPPSLYSFWGVSLVLAFVNYPYVYLLTRASLLTQNFVYSEAAQILGASRIRILTRINIPLVYPGIAAGLALALMEVLADFGTVALLRYPTFTEAIYRQMTARFDPQGAAALSSLLLVMTLFLLVGERYFRGKGRFDQTKGSFRAYVPKGLSRLGGLFVSLFLGSILTFAFLTPTAVLAIWAGGQVWSGGIDPGLMRFGLNSLMVAAAGATLAVILALPVAYLHARYPAFLHRGAFHLSTLGYSLPGPVIAVGLLLTLPVFFPWIYGGVSLLLLAYVIRFIPVALQSQDSSLATVSRSLEEASRTLGAGLWKTVTRITLPLIKPGLITGWVVVFADCLKELPATLMLRPIGFDTLSVRVWMEASEAFWEMAALPALMIVLAGIIPIAYIIRLGTKKGDKSSDIS